MHDPDVVILLFASGKPVCTGAVNEQMVYNATGKLMAELIARAKPSCWKALPPHSGAPETIVLQCRQPFPHQSNVFLRKTGELGIRKQVYQKD